jgi:hypothetical protein
VVTLEDPRGDDHGPGGYLYPSGSEYRPGDFDLRRFSVRVEGQDAVFEVTLGANVRRNIVQQRGDRGDLILDNGIYTQNVDIYLDTTPGAGFTEGLPGRRVAFPASSGWDRAIAVVPRPGALRTELGYWDVEKARHVLTPGPVRTTGQTLSVRVPLAFLGGAPRRDWGYAVMVSGAAWDVSFAALDHLRGTHTQSGLTLPVYGVPEERAFGGGRLNSGNPHVIDVVLPEGVSQEKVLGSYGKDRPAVIPMVYPAGAPPAPVPDGGQTAEKPVAQQSVPSPAPPGPVAGGPLDPSRLPPPSPPAQKSGRLTLEIASVEGDTVVIPTPERAPRQWQLGTVVDAQGQQLGRVVVTSVSKGFVVANVTEGRGRVQPGHRVQFTTTPSRSPR